MRTKYKLSFPSIGPSSHVKNKVCSSVIKSTCFVTLMLIFSGAACVKAVQEKPAQEPSKVDQQKPTSVSTQSEPQKLSTTPSMAEQQETTTGPTQTDQKKTTTDLSQNDKNSSPDKKESVFKIFQSWFDLLFGGALGAALGYLIKWGLEQFSLRVAARREFAEKVTEQISKLATEHYWSLANYAGVVSGRLEIYLQMRAYHLLLQWNDPSDLHHRLDELADEAAKSSFPHLCRLIASFDAFQFEESNTYLLTDHAAGETCKRLYNTFVGSLPEKLNLANLYASEITDKNGKKEKIGLLHPAYITEEVIMQHEHLANEWKTWRNWLRNNLEDIIQSADALRAYNELLLDELASLYRDWFKQEQPEVPYIDELVFNDWPNVLTEQSFIVIARTRQQPALLSPLGAAITGIQLGTGEEEKPPGDGGRIQIGELGKAPPLNPKN